MRALAPHRPTLFVVAGLPGAGKTTLATKIALRRGAVRMSADDWLAELGYDKWNGEIRDRVETLQRSLTAEILSAGASVVIEWGTWTRAEREELARMARSRGAGTELVVLDPPIEMLLERVVRRGPEGPPITHAQLKE